MVVHNEKASQARWRESYSGAKDSLAVLSLCSETDAKKLEKNRIFLLIYQLRFQKISLDREIDAFRVRCFFTRIVLTQKGTRNANLDF